MIEASEIVREKEQFDADRYFDLAIETSKEWGKRHAEPRFVSRTIKTDRPISVTFTSDWHIGSPGTAHRQLRDDMRCLANHPQMYTFLGGDWADNYVVPKLQMVGQQNVFAAGEQQAVIALLIAKPLFDTKSVIAVGRGNHNGWTQAVSGIDPLYHTFRDAPELATREGCVLSLHVGEVTYRIFRRHRPRYSSVYSPGHAIVGEYQRSPFDFDIGVVEHEHMSWGGDFDGKLRDDGTTTRIAIRPGTYKVEDRFADEHGYYYSSTVQQSVILWPDRFRMLRVRGLEDTAELLEKL
jgi:hypothetical protein